MKRILVRLGAALALASAVSATAAAAAPSHAFDVWYRGFGPVSSSAEFRAGDGYQLRFEGCWAKHTPEAVCGFTLKAVRPVVLTNLANLSHGAAPDGTAVRTCCLFAEGRPEGYPITATAGAPQGVGVYRRTLKSGESVPVLLRVPDHARGPLATITFSRGEGDAGLSFPAAVREIAP